ncbi:hypothetical protein PENNAL_c0331G09803, partial [Penicillium nalgiovense]
MTIVQTDRHVSSALWDSHEQENTLVSVTRVECHANKS